MTIKQPNDGIEVALYREQIERLEELADDNPDVDTVDELLRLIIAERTDTLEQLRMPSAQDIEKIRSLLEWQQNSLERLSEEMKEEVDTDTEAMFDLLMDIRTSQEKIAKEIENEVIY